MSDLGSLVTTLERLSEPFRSRPSAWERLGFEPFVDAEEVARLVKKGWWHTYWVGHSPAGRFQVGLRVLPTRGWSQWPVVLAFDRCRAVTFAEGLCSAAALLIFDAANTSSRIFETLSRERDELTRIAGPFYEAIDGMRELDHLLRYLGARAPGAEATSTNGAGERRDFALGLEASEEHRTFLHAVGLMVENETALPGWPVGPLGVWTPSLANTMAARAAYLAPGPQTSEALWRGFVQPHGYDASDGYVSFRPDESAECYWGVERVLPAILDSSFPLRGALEGTGLFEAAQRLARHGVERYKGTAHLEAAAALDEAGDGEAAWNALVSAAYWSGRNLDESMEPVHDAAIYLAERHGWSDALAALERQRKAAAP